ncbi:conjugative transfer protein MobI(A/C) [Lamprocystis purpurea]|jgi:hypothetical protein|uniref:conjugative transfer protein MobI(A/C) n=1 Tax=Lamprocystis purpurea TaxID=61598 RepID=UPI00037DB94C|nr:conjugative transfer protein MobI(A/C) [Lamprocystis purpurea]
MSGTTTSDAGRASEAGGALGWDDDAATAAGVDRWVVANLATLYQQAEDAVMRFEARQAEAGRDIPRSAWGKIGVRVRRQQSPAATPGAFVIEWVRYRFTAPTAAGRRCQTVYIQRGTGDRYPRSAFRNLARPWQTPLVMEAEEALGRIRALTRQIAQVRTQLRAAERAKRDFYASLCADTPATEPWD